MSTLIRFLLVLAVASLAGVAAFAVSVTPFVSRLAAGVLMALLVGFVGGMTAVSCGR